ncbi:hypothetical protein AO385_1431 [Moraxella catarrhalis]|nr:hypothetical protein AO385_1431 [Moraxella catarrhalis]
MKNSKHVAVNFYKPWFINHGLSIIMILTSGASNILLFNDPKYAKITPLY